MIDTNSSSRPGLLKIIWVNPWIFSGLTFGFAISLIALAGTPKGFLDGTPVFLFWGLAAVLLVFAMAQTLRTRALLRRAMLVQGQVVSMLYGGRFSNTVFYEYDYSGKRLSGSRGTRRQFAEGSLLVIAVDPKNFYRSDVIDVYT